jgi:hypothetical protein
VVVVDKLGEYEVVPVATVEPLVEALYQSIVQPLGALALNATVPVPQRLLLLALVGAAGTALMVIDPLAVLLSQLFAFFTLTE